MTSERTCIACRTKADRAELLRVVAGPEGRPAVDFSGRWPGRGAHLCYKRECLQGGARPAVLGRALRSELAEMDEDWALDAVRRHQIRRIGELCGLMQKSGRLKSGAHTCAMALERGWVRAGLLAADVREDAARKLRRRCEATGRPVVELPLTSLELGRAVGKERRSVAVMGHGRLAEELERALKRYRGLL